MTRILFVADERSIYIVEESLSPDELARQVNAGMYSLALPRAGGRWTASRNGPLVVANWVPDTRNIVDPTPPLTPREREVLDALAAGHTQKAIASRLHLTTRTVREYMRILRYKLGAETTGQLLVRAVSLGLCQPPVVSLGEDNHPK